MLPLHACIEQREYGKTHQINAGGQHRLSGVNESERVTHRHKHVSVCFQVRSQVPLQYAVLPAIMCDDQPELCPCNVPWQGHKLLGRGELVEVWPCQIIRSLCWGKGFLYQVLGNTLQSNSSLISRRENTYSGWHGPLGAGDMLPYIILIEGMTLCTFEEESVVIR